MLVYVCIMTSLLKIINIVHTHRNLPLSPQELFCSDIDEFDDEFDILTVDLPRIGCSTSFTVVVMIC